MSVLLALGTIAKDFVESRPKEQLIAGGAAAAGFLAFYWEASGNLLTRWGAAEELSHSYFIPLISLWLIWSNREAVKSSIGAPTFVGLGVVAASVGLGLLGKLINFYFVEHVAMLSTIVGLVLSYGGFSLLRVLAAPLIFLVFAVPPPHWVMTALSWQFQQMSSVLGVAMLRLADVPVFLTGNIIDLGVYKLQVAEACSGLRYLFPFVSLGVITAYLFKAPFWQKGVVVAATVPITIVMNSFRIAVTGILVERYGTDHAEGFLHFFEGWVVFILCLAALFFVVKGLSVLSGGSESAIDRLRSPELTPAKPTAGVVDPKFIWGGGGVALVGAFIVAATFITDVYVKPERRSFAEFPYEFGDDWRHEMLPLDEAVAEALNADDVIVANLQSPEGGVFNVYFAYLAERAEGKSWHSPRQCIPGGGWRITHHDIVETQTSTSGSFHYNRLIIQNQEHRQLLYYWYDQRGRKIADEFAMRFWTVWDSITRRRADGSMVRLLTPIGRDESVKSAEARLQGFVEQVDAALPEYIPH